METGLQIPEDGPIDTTSLPALPTATVQPSPVAPVWHTVVLIAGIALLSVAGAAQFSGGEASFNRLPTYAFTAATELCMLAWVYFGLRLRKVPLRSLLGSVSGSFESIVVDVGFAMLFWIGSLIVLGTIGIFWTVIEASITHHSLFPSGQQLAPDSTQQQTIHTLAQLAPTNWREVAAWILLCIIAGFVEEVVFRGYLQRQFTVWSRGAAAAGVALSALLFGAAHGYQGARNMVLLAVFGALFSSLALLRRSLRAGIFAHSWHDLFVGLMLALLRAHHVV